MKLCYFFIATVCVLASAQDVEDYNGDYDNFYDYDTLKAEGEQIEAELDKLDAESDLKVKEDIEKFENDNVDVAPANDIEDTIDYQVEDNRDKDVENRKEVHSDNVGSFEGDETGDIFNDASLETVDEVERKKQADQADYALLWGDDNVAPLPIPETETSQEDKEIIEEARQILENDDGGFEDVKNPDTPSNNEPDYALLWGDDKVEPLPIPQPAETSRENKGSIEDMRHLLGENDGDVLEADASNNDYDMMDQVMLDTDLKDTVVSQDVNKPDDEIIEETKQILEETDDSFNNNDQNGIEEIQDGEKLDAEEAQNQDLVVEPIDDLDKDSNINENQNADVEVDNQEYEDLNADLDNLFETLNKLTNDSSDNKKIEDEIFDKLDDQLFKDDETVNVEGSEELVDDAKVNMDYQDVDFESIMKDILEENDMDVSANKVDSNQLLNDEINEPNPDDAFEKDAEVINEQSEPILFLDAIVDGEPKNGDKDASGSDNTTTPATVEVKKEPETVDIENLNSQELEDLMVQFSAAHSEDLDVHSESFDQNVAPIHITLNVDEPVVVTSPNYPGAYPTNNIVDWIFDGEGMGIELNITDFLVNGALGDYLLIKPGGTDESGHEGLVFTYRLNSERRFRFADVNRMFVRFESKPGMMFMRGFSFSVKMIAPLPEETEQIPEPEAIRPPLATTTVHLALPASQFRGVEEQFRLLLADMAEEYIRMNDIYPGVNATSEVTQITSVSACPVAWPDYEHCTAVTFGIPLSSEDDEDGKMLGSDELVDMWITLKTRDPFALQLSQMGISEFSPPGGAVLTAWLVIASGVVLSMAMLAVVLWRFSCFEDYTRMRPYSDTDSVHEKRGLDLYPTPHQTLPPLFAEDDKWHDDTTRVDMGGFANKSYARDMYDFESDEEVVTTRTGAVTARDIYGGSNA